MTERLYYHDSSILAFKSRVTGITRAGDVYRVTLDKTAFYPTSGGQLHDTGNISGDAVVEVIEENGEVYHVLAGKPQFEVGDKVAGKIDDARRRDNMQKHTGQHILSRSLIEIADAETVSARLGAEDSTIDINRETLPGDSLARAEDLANLIIFQNRPVRIEFVPHDQLKDIPLRKIPDRTEEVYRIIIIENFDWSACGGTHCTATGAVGVIKITGQEKIRSNLRLHFLTGLIALDDYRWRFDQIDQISNLFTRHGKESVTAVKALFAENTLLRRKNAELKKELLPSYIEKWYAGAVDVGGRRIIALDFSGEDFREAREAALGIINAHEVVALILVDDKILVGVAKEMPLSAAELVTKVAAHFGGKGGGSPQLAQGGGFRPEDLKVLIADPGRIFDL